MPAIFNTGLWFTTNLSSHFAGLDNWLHNKTIKRISHYRVLENSGWTLGHSAWSVHWCGSTTGTCHLSVSSWWLHSLIQTNIVSCNSLVILISTTWWRWWPPSCLSRSRNRPREQLLHDTDRNSEPPPPHLQLISTGNSEESTDELLLFRVQSTIETYTAVSIKCGWWPLTRWATRGENN